MKSVYSIDCVWYVQSLVGEDSRGFPVLLGKANDLHLTVPAVLPNTTARLETRTEESSNAASTMQSTATCAMKVKTANTCGSGRQCRFGDVV